MPTAPHPPDDTPLDQLRLPTRTIKALAAQSYTTVGQVRTLSDVDLLLIPGLGRTALQALRDLTQQHMIPMQITNAEDEARRILLVRRELEEFERVLDRVIGKFEALAKAHRGRDAS